MKIKKIKCKEANLKIRGQGCWDDCHHDGYFKGKSSFKDIPPCDYVRPYDDAVTWPFW